MPAKFRHLVPAIALALFAIASTSASARSIWSDIPRDVTLDINGDGKPDRAVLMNATTGSTDLYIYLGAGDGLLDPSLTPDIVKKNLTVRFILTYEATKKGSLRVGYGCGGCSNDTVTTLTIVHRNGTFWVGGYSYDWETRDFGAGSCDINFLTGKATMAKDGGRTRAIKGTFKPVKLTGWSEERHVKVCGF
jgi:hypothetical protein